MNVWSSLGGLAQFPGTLVLGDARATQEAYPSDGVTPESLALLEPCLSPTAVAQGARLYRQEGGQLIGHWPCNALAGDAEGICAPVLPAGFSPHQMLNHYYLPVQSRESGGRSALVRST